MTTNPYVGPRSFETNETLYGRDRELRQLTDRLIAERIVLLHSPSGAGKTSLVQAGLIPQLREEGFFVHPVVRVNLERSANLIKISDTLKDTKRFNRYTFSTLISLEERYPQEKRADLTRLARMSLDEYLVFRLKEDKRDEPEFLIFDQFEEVLTIDPTDRASKNAFFAHLGSALKNRDRWALFAMRTDYVGALEPYVRTVPTYFSNTFHLELLGVKAAIEAIQKPAQTQGVDFTNSAAQKLADDLRRVQVQLLDGSMETQLGLYVEPVQLQVVCYRLWESKVPADNDIDEKDLASVGDVNESLAEYYDLSVDKVATTTGVTERSIREWFDRKLITPDGIRSQVRMGAETSDGLENAAVRKLEDAHLIRAEKRAGQTWYELAHDRLIEPVRNDNKKWFVANLSLFQRQALLWTEKGRSEGLLLRGSELESAETEAQGITLTQDEIDFFEACRVLKEREKRDRNQRRMIIIGAAVSFIFFIVALIASINATNANKGFEEQALTARAAEAEAISQRSAAQAASTEAYQNADKAATARAEAVKEKENAQKEAANAQTQQANAYQKANEAATAQAIAITEKAKAEGQAKIAQASELVAQSILANNKAKTTAERGLATLLAIEAFNINDNYRTRSQLFTFISSSLSLAQTSKTGLTTNIVFGANGTVLASQNVDCDIDNLLVCYENSLNTWDTRNVKGRVITKANKTALNAETLDAIAISPDGNIIASAFCKPASNGTFICDEENIVLWDAKTFERIGDPIPVAQNSKSSSVVLLAYSPDGKTLALANNSKIAFIDLQKGAEISQTDAMYLPTSNSVLSAPLVFSTDGKSLAYGSQGKIVILDVKSLQKKELAAGTISNQVYSLAFSPDGKYLASGTRDGNIFLWDAKTFEKIDGASIVTSANDRLGKVTSLVFSPDSKTLAAGYATFDVILWDMEKRTKLVRLPVKHTSEVNSLAMSQDGKLLASSASEIIVWSMDKEVWIEIACDFADRNMSQAEWQEYFPNTKYANTCSKYPAGK